jgi:uncharacterized protein
LALREVGFEQADRLWVRGGFPKSFLARSDRESMEWRQAFIRTFLERDLPALGVNIAADTMRRFWSMLAHHHVQLWNASEIGRSFGVADTSVRNYLDKLTDALVVRQLKHWHENLGKRQVKAPKIYIRDSGLLHSLLNLPTKVILRGIPSPAHPGRVSSSINSCSSWVCILKRHITGEHIRVPNLIYSSCAEG